MTRRLVASLLISSLTCLAVAVAATATVEEAKSGHGGAKAANQSPEVSFNLNRLLENPKLYNLIMSDTDEHVISGTFSLEQLQILRAIMVEAEKFSLSDEAVGTKAPITTRFMDKQEPAFIVDVQKAANQAQLFLTLQTETGRMTWEAGRIIRSSRREDGFFFDLLSRLESVLPKLPTQPRK